MALQVGDKVYGPGIVKNAAQERIQMTVEALDVMPEQTKKRADGVQYHNCSYTLNDRKHVETFAEDSLSPV